MRIILATAIALGLALPATAQTVVKVDSTRVKTCSGKWYPIDPARTAEFKALCDALKGYTKRGSEFPVDSPTKPETPAQRRERQYQERFNKADAQRIRKAQNDYDKRQREYQREEGKLKSLDCRVKSDSCPAPDFDRAWEDEKKRKEEEAKNRRESEQEGADGNAVRIRRMNNPYQPNIWPKPKTKQLDPNAFVKPKKKLTVKEQREMEKFLNLFPDEKK